MLIPKRGNKLVPTKNDWWEHRRKAYRIYANLFDYDPQTDREMWEWAKGV